MYNLFHNRNTLNSFYLTPFFSTQYFTFCHTGQELLVLWRVHHLKYFGPYACISCQIGADVTFLIRGDLIQKLSCQVFGNYPRDQLSKFFVVPKISKYLEVLRSTDPFLINTRNWVISEYKSIYKNLFLVNKHLLTSYFFGSFLFETKAKQTFPSFHFDIYFKINPVLPLGFKVINVKNLHSKNLKRKFKYCNVNICNSLTSVIEEFPTSNFIFVISYLCKTKDWTTCLCSFYSQVYLAISSNCMEKFR